MFSIKNIKKITSGSLLAFMALTYWTAKAENAVANNSVTDVTAELMLSIDVSGEVSIRMNTIFKWMVTQRLLETEK